MSEPIAKATWAPILEYKRNGITEVVVHGAISWVSAAEVVHEVGGQNVIFGRSLTKPFQMKCVAKDLDSLLTPQGKSLSVASHMSELAQMQALESILSAEGRALIATPISMPLAPIEGVKDASPLYHPCSGKHAAILRVCAMKNWPAAGYTEPGHPYHQAYVTELRKVLGPEWTEAVRAKDGCGLPTLSMSVTELAKLYASLYEARADDWIWRAMIDFPELVGGKNRLDSLIIKACGGHVLAKEGADGLLGLSIEHRDYPEGLGVVIKLAHGWDPKAMWFVASAILRTLGFTFGNPAPLDRQRAFVSASIVPTAMAQKFQGLIQNDNSAQVDDQWA